jgi:hypothetical protein
MRLASTCVSEQYLIGGIDREHLPRGSMSSRKHPFGGSGIEGSLSVSLSGTPSGGPSCWPPPSALGSASS